MNQNARTKTQNEIIQELRTDIQDIRSLVKLSTDNKDIWKTFGIGESSFTNIVSSATAHANIVIQAYNDHLDWAGTEGGILECDITEITALRDSLASADDVQEKIKFTRKTKTLDKDTLRRGVEDMTTKISATGVKVFRKTDPSKVKLFEDLI